MSEKPSTSTQATDDQVIADARYIEFIDFSETEALAVLQRTIKPTVAALLRRIDQWQAQLKSANELLGAAHDVCALAPSDIDYPLSEEAWAAIQRLGRLINHPGY